MHYLGLNKEKKKILKPSEKFRNIFNFEWDVSEDTAYDTNPMYNNRTDANLLFGRGLRAGMDVREQKRNAVEYDKLIRRYDESVPVNKEKKSKKDKKDKKEKKDKKDKKGKKDKREKKEKATENNGDSKIEMENKNDFTQNKSDQQTNDSNFNNKMVIESDDKNRNDQTNTITEGGVAFNEDPHVKDIRYKNLAIKYLDLGETKHWSLKSTEDMTERDWRIFREDHDIIIKGGRVPKPMRIWDDLNLTDNLHEAIKRAQYKKPTPIQMQALPIGRERKDMIGRVIIEIIPIKLFFVIS